MTFLGYVVGAIVIIITMGLVGLFWGAVLSFKNYLTSFRENFNYQGSEL
jgi:hypothetical protein